VERYESRLDPEVNGKAEIQQDEDKLIAPWHENRGQTLAHGHVRMRSYAQIGIKIVLLDYFNFVVLPLIPIEVFQFREIPDESIVVPF